MATRRIGGRLWRILGWHPGGETWEVRRRERGGGLSYQERLSARRERNKHSGHRQGRASRRAPRTTPPIERASPDEAVRTAGAVKAGRADLSQQSVGAKTFSRVRSFEMAGPNW